MWSRRPMRRPTILYRWLKNVWMGKGVRQQKKITTLMDSVWRLFRAVEKLDRATCRLYGRRSALVLVLWCWYYIDPFLCIFHLFDVSPPTLLKSTSLSLLPSLLTICVGLEDSMEFAHRHTSTFAQVLREKPVLLITNGPGTCLPLIGMCTLA